MLYFKPSMKYFFVVLILALASLGLCFKQFIYEKWIRYALRDEHIVVSLTTTPHRINAIKPVIDFLLKEDVPLQAIYLNIPHVFKRDNLKYEIPAWLENHPRVTILRTNDYGPGTKLLGTLEQTTLPEKAIIITVDDDNTYPKNLLLHLAYRAKQHANYAIGYSGMNPHYNSKHKVIVDSLLSIGLKPDKRDQAFVAVLEGFAGVAYRKYFFDNSIFEIENAPRECRNSDDVYISFYLARRGIPRQVVRTKYMQFEKVAWNPEVGFNEDALHKLSPHPAKRHRACIEFMQDQNPYVRF